MIGGEKTRATARIAAAAAIFFACVLTAAANAHHELFAGANGVLNIRCDFVANEFDSYPADLSHGDNNRRYCLEYQDPARDFGNFYNDAPGADITGITVITWRPPAGVADPNFINLLIFNASVNTGVYDSTSSDTLYLQPRVDDAPTLFLSDFSWFGFDGLTLFPFRQAHPRVFFDVAPDPAAYGVGFLYWSQPQILCGADETRTEDRTRCIPDGTDPPPPPITTPGGAVITATVTLATTVTVMANTDMTTTATVTTEITSTVTTATTATVTTMVTTETPVTLTTTLTITTDTGTTETSTVTTTLTSTVTTAITSTVTTMITTEIPTTLTSTVTAAGMPVTSTIMTTLTSTVTAAAITMTTVVTAERPITLTTTITITTDTGMMVISTVTATTTTTVTATLRTTGAGDAPPSPGTTTPETPPPITIRGGGGTNSAVAAFGAASAIAFAMALYAGGPAAFDFAPDFGYALSEDSYSYRYGGRLDWRRNNWRLYWTARQTYANGSPGELIYGGGGKWTKSPYTFAFSEIIAGDSADRDASFALDWNRGKWGLHSAVKTRWRADDEQSLWRHSLHLRGAWRSGGGREFRYGWRAHLRTDGFAETREHFLHLDAVFRRYRWTIRSSAEFRGAQFGDFADDNVLRIEAVREF